MIIFMYLFLFVAIIVTTLGIFFGGLYLIARINEVAEQEKFAFFRYSIGFVLVLMFVSMNGVIDFAGKLI